MSLIGIIIPNPGIEKLYFFSCYKLFLKMTSLVTVLPQPWRKLQLLSAIPG